MKKINLSPKRLFGAVKSFNIKAVFKNKKKRRIFIAVIVLIALLVGISAFALHSKMSSGKSESVTAEVTRGTVNNVIEGTGTIAAISQYEITSLAKGDVVADYFEEGDYVTKDQLLYKIDSESVNKNIEKQKNSIEKAQLSYSDAAQSASDLNVKSDISGVVMNVYVSEGDNVQSGTKIADVTDSSSLYITLPFGDSDARSIYVGEGATVTLSGNLQTLYGTVTSVSSGTYTNSYGVNVSDVEICVTNPGTVTEGEAATAMVGVFACYDSGTVKYKNSRTITAKTSGEVTAIRRKKGSSVKSGETIVSLKSTNASRSVKEAQISLKDAQLSLDNLYDDLEDYNITSPIDGKVIQKNIKAGEKLETNSTNTMAIIADLSTLTFDISIDELDISSISEGQEVSITADAIIGKTFTGKVSKISIVGESEQGVTSYPVTVTVDDGEDTGLIPGMNVTAQIIVDSAKDVLRVPVSAVRGGGFLIVKGKGESTAQTSDNKDEMPQDKSNGADNKSGTDESSDSKNREKSAMQKIDVPDGYHLVRVETGLSDGSFIEIKDGDVKEGDTVLLPDITASSDSKDSEQQGMLGGGMPGGGMPGGGGGMPGGGGGMPGGGGGMPGGGGRSSGGSRPN